MSIVLLFYAILVAKIVIYSETCFCIWDFFSIRCNFGGHQVAAQLPDLRPSPEPRQFFESYILHNNNSPFSIHNLYRLITVATTKKV